jgi:hypothetical protein
LLDGLSHPFKRRILADNFLEQRLPPLEHAIQRGARDPCAVGHLVHRQRGEPVATEQVERRLQETSMCLRLRRDGERLQQLPS